jgi:gag-polypeptide of LTR copia-type
MKKGDMQTMHTWIAAVRHLAHEFTEAGTTVTDDDTIIVLMLGLPLTYENFVITLDVTPDEQLTLDLVITRLLNEES